jgi:DNA (cytosine-5)-methyltransferase 1
MGNGAPFKVSKQASFQLKEDHATDSTLVDTADADAAAISASCGVETPVSRQNSWLTSTKSAVQPNLVPSDSTKEYKAIQFESQRSASHRARQDRSNQRHTATTRWTSGHAVRLLPMARRPRLLDLFCCAGGAGVGYHRAGFDVVGVDIDLQPRYPFEFIQHDALTLDPDFIQSFDAIHASPPCQSYSDLAKRNGNADEWPRLIDPVREILNASGKPWIIENVEGAPLINPIILCGTMFPELRVIRHRLFESNIELIAPSHPWPHPLVFTHDKRKNHYGKLDQDVSFVQVTGGGNCTMDNARDAMGIDWMKTKVELNESIPPAYTEYLGHQLMQRVAVKSKARAA